jgi:hypothetical protein
MDEEKRKEWGILVQTHNVAANSWGKGGLGNGQSFTTFMPSLRMGPQHLILYAKKIVIRLGDGLWVVIWLGNYPKACIPLQLFIFCNFCGYTRAVMVQLEYVHGQ